MAHTKSFKELLKQYNVRASWSIDSNLVYPLDSNKFKSYGYIPQEDVDAFINKISYLLDENLEMKVSNAYIANKYASGSNAFN